MSENVRMNKPFEPNRLQRPLQHRMRRRHLKNEDLQLRMNFTAKIRRGAQHADHTNGYQKSAGPKQTNKASPGAPAFGPCSATVAFSESSLFPECRRRCRICAGVVAIDQFPFIVKLSSVGDGVPSVGGGVSSVEDCSLRSEVNNSL